MDDTVDGTHAEIRHDWTVEEILAIDSASIFARGDRWIPEIGGRKSPTFGPITSRERIFFGYTTPGCARVAPPVCGAI